MKNYYHILGVSPQASREEIKQAYRKLARELHPDTRGNSSREEFLKVKEAFDVLSDSQKRADYNRNRQSESGSGRARQNVNSVSFANRRTIFDELFRDFQPIRRKGSAQQTNSCAIKEDAAIDVVLYPDEARKGGELRIDIPVNCLCDWCGGSGSQYLFLCSSCFGEGVIERRKMVTLMIPSNVKNGEINHLDLQTFGIEGYLKIYFVINS